MLDRILTALRLSSKATLAVFPFGSRVYGTFKATSDYDFVVVTDDDTKDGQEIRNGDLNIHLYSAEKFAQNLADHKVVPIECIMAPPEHRLHTLRDFAFRLDRSKLRSQFAEKASNSWVKGKKKLTVENDFYIGKKSIWHALRITMFGIQIARDGAITDFGVANRLYDEIVKSAHVDWDHFKSGYQGLFNSLSSEFRALAPK